MSRKKEGGESVMRKKKKKKKIKPVYSPRLKSKDGLSV